MSTQEFSAAARARATAPTAELAAALAAELRGELMTAQDAGYDAARAVYNGMIDRRPWAIARCANAADVVRCVQFANRHGVELAVRGGGHNAGGFGVWDDALVVDLCLMRGVTVEPESHSVRVEGGCTWSDVDNATVPFGLATPSGFLASTGVGGLSLGGGVGYLTRRYGLTVDNLLSADVVLADGRLVQADAHHHPELFWALRGGGGNFGVVVSFHFACHEVGEQGTVVGGPILYDVADTPAVMRWYRELLPSLPEELSGWIGVLTIPPVPSFPQEVWGRKSIGIVWCYTGPAAQADAVTAPIRAFGSPLVVGLSAMPFSTLQSMFDALYPAGLQWYWKADMFTEISDAAIAVHAKYAALLPTGHSTMHLYPVDGAAARVAADATAFPYRRGGWAGSIVGVDPDPAQAARITQWAKDYWAELHPMAADAVYVNFLGQEGQDRIRAAYGGNYERLARVKAHYDPGNLFHINQNIPPAPVP